MKLIRTLILSAVAAASMSAMAATDGVANATQSVGTFTNTLGNTPAVGIRVFGLKDATILANTPALPTRWGNLPAVADSFCVANTTGAAVTIRFTSPGLTASGGNVISATSAQSGATTGYHQMVNLATVRLSEFDVILPGNALVIPQPQMDLSNCSNPNVTKVLLAYTGTPGPSVDTFVDTMTVTATLN